MANRNFNKQIVPARKKLAVGGTLSPKKPKSFDNTDRTPRPKSFNNTDTTDREQIIRDRLTAQEQVQKEKRRKQRPGSPRPLPIQPRDPRDKMEPRRPMPKLPGKPGRPGPSRPMPKLPGRPRPPMKRLTPEQIQRLKELFKKRRKGLDPKDPKFKKSIDSLKEKMQKTGRPRPKGRKKLMGGGSSSSREAMMHGFYNKDMGMGKKKK